MDSLFDMTPTNTYEPLPVRMRPTKLDHLYGCLLYTSIHELARVDVANQGHKADYVTIVAGEEWHPGVIGIVASRLVEEFYKPTLVISIHDGVGKGSCRSICLLYTSRCV